MGKACDAVLRGAFGKKNRNKAQEGNPWPWLKNFLGNDLGEFRKHRELANTCNSDEKCPRVSLEQKLLTKNHRLYAVCERREHLSNRPTGQSANHAFMRNAMIWKLIKQVSFSQGGMQILSADRSVQNHLFFWLSTIHRRVWRSRQIQLDTGVANIAIQVVMIGVDQCDSLPAQYPLTWSLDKCQCHSLAYLENFELSKNALQFLIVSKRDRLVGAGNLRSLSWRPRSFNSESKLDGQDWPR